MNTALKQMVNALAWWYWVMVHLGGLLSTQEARVALGYRFVLSNLPSAPYNNYSMSPRWIWSDKITNERVARVGYNHFISNKGEWNNCFSNILKRGFAADIYFHNFTKRKFLNLAHYFPYEVKLQLLAQEFFSQSKS